MPWELIYTSAPRGLALGQSGFCTVARTADLREALVQRLEQISSYHYLEPPTAGNVSRRNPIIFACRFLDIRGTKFHVLSRILPCGLDFTARTNHLAHHLIFGAEELVALAWPAAILRDWPGWRNSWEGEPRVLEPLAAGSFSRLPAPVWPAEAWRQLTGDAGRAAGLLEPEYSRGCYLLAPPGGDNVLLNLFYETQQLLDPSRKFPQRAWQNTFTTFLQGEDVVSDFQWRGCQEKTPAYEQAIRRSATVVPIQSVRVPNNALAKLAREGRKLPVAPTKVLQATGASQLTLNRPPVRGAVDLPGQRNPARQNRWEPSEDSSGWNITISLKSLVGIGIAAVILTGLLAVHFHWFGSHIPESKKTAAQAAGQTNTGTSGQSTASPSPPPALAATPVAPTVAKHTEPPFDSKKAEKELAGLLPEVWTRMYVVSSLPDDHISLAGMTNLAVLLQRLGRIDVTPADLEFSLVTKSWGMASKLALRGNSDPLRHQLVLNGPVGGDLTFDYSNLSDTNNPEQVSLQSRFNPEQADAASSFSIIFKPAAPSRTQLESFGLLVVNASNPPPALILKKRYLQMDGGSMEKTIRDPLWSRLKLLHGPLVWRLRPYVFTNSAGGTPEDLCKLLPAEFPPELRDHFTAALDLTLVNQSLDQQRGKEARNLVQFNQQLQEQSTSNLPGFDRSFPLGPVLGVTNETLASFGKFAEHEAKPTSKHFTEYLKKLVKTAKPHQPWLEEWSDGSEESTRPKLKRLYELCAVNLPPNAASTLNLTNGPVTENYFVTGWETLKRDEEIEKLTKEKDAAEKNTESWRQLSALVPKNLEELAEVRLMLVDPANPGQELEVIRFTDSVGK